MYADICQLKKMDVWYVEECFIKRELKYLNSNWQPTLLPLTIYMYNNNHSYRCAHTLSKQLEVMYNRQ